MAASREYRNCCCACFMTLLVAILAVGRHHGGSCSDYSDYSGVDPVTDPSESEAVFDILSSLNPEVPWRQTFGSDDICASGPHGVYCQVDPTNTYRVTELNLGWISDTGNNPPCSQSSRPTLHPSLTRLRYLSKLFVYQCFNNQSYSLPDFLFSITSLTHLVFLRNPSLSGLIPAGLGNLVNLRRLVLSGNNLRGAIPNQISHLKNLVQLDLSSNQLSGSIPASFSALPSLKLLDLNSNSFQGPIPDSLLSLSQLLKLDLSKNQLSGAVKPLLGSLQLLDLSQNNLTGGIPVSISSMQGLRQLKLSGNPLGGELPTSWSGMPSLVGIEAANAGLEGSIPASMGKLVKLRYLDLGGNRLGGKIPAEIGRLEELHYMNLSGNHLAGVAPFDSAFLGRVGKNLHMEGNEGICYPSGFNIYPACEEPADLDTSLRMGSKAVSRSSSSGANNNINAVERKTVVFFSGFLLSLVFCLSLP